MPAFVLLFLLTISFSTFAQVNKVFESDVLAFNGERLELKKNGRYEFSEWGCLQATSGNGTYKLKGDTVTIISYEADKFPFEITQAYDRKVNDMLYVDMMGNMRGVITSIMINDSIKIFELPKKTPFRQHIISIAKPLIAKMTIYYLLPDRKSQVSKDVYIGSNNVVTIKTDNFDSYFRPLTLPDKWLIKGDTLYNYNKSSFLVDSSLSIELSDMWSD